MTHDDPLDPQPGDGTDLLCQAVYLRPAHPRDYIGGSNCRMLRDAAATLTDLRRENARLRQHLEARTLAETKSDRLVATLHIAHQALFNRVRFGRPIDMVELANKIAAVLAEVTPAD